MHFEGVFVLEVYRNTFIQMELELDLSIRGERTLFFWWCPRPIAYWQTSILLQLCVLQHGISVVGEGKPFQIHMACTVGSSVVLYYLIVCPFLLQVVLKILWIDNLVSIVTGVNWFWILHCLLVQVDYQFSTVYSVIWFLILAILFLASSKMWRIYLSISCSKPLACQTCLLFSYILKFCFSILQMLYKKISWTSILLSNNWTHPFLCRSWQLLISWQVNYWN